MKISAIIKTSNSEDTLCKTLESIKDLDEVIVIDENSKDDTLEIIKSYKAKVIYAEKNNLSLAYNQAKNETNSDWILILEDKEAINFDLINEIKNAVEKKNAIAFYIYQRNFFFNKELKVAKTKALRLFKKDNVEFFGDWEIKTNLIKEKKSKIYTIKEKNGAIFNFGLNNIEKEYSGFFEKNRYYLKYLETNKKASLFKKPLFEFLYWYFVKKAFLEGKLGYIFSFNKAIKKYFFETMKFEKETKNNDF